MRPLRFEAVRPDAQAVGPAALVHQRGHRHRPAVADPANQVPAATSASVKNTWLNDAWPFICLQRLHIDARLAACRSRNTTSPCAWARPSRCAPAAGRNRPVGARGPHLLAVDHPGSCPCKSARVVGAGEVRAAARLAEELAPGVLAGEDAAQKLLFLQIRAVREDRRGRQRADAGLGDADGADAWRTPRRPRRTSATGKPRPYHALGQCGTPQPESTSLLRHSTEASSGFQLASSQARTSAGRLFGRFAHLTSFLKPPSAASSAPGGSAARRAAPPSFWRA